MDRPVGRAKSCVTCRQYKLRCDARQMAPNPCSRCVSKNLKCRFDPHFKRISTRRIAQEVAEELHALRAAQNNDARTSDGRSQAPLPTTTLTTRTPSDAQSVRSSVSSQEPQTRAKFKNSKWLKISDKETIIDQNLQGVAVNSATVILLFRHFEQNYYPHARFLQRLNSINDLSNKHPLLFWTIMLVATERYEGYESLYEQLCLAHETLLAAVVHVAIQSLEEIHALLLLALWPVPKIRGVYDPSWNYTGLAIQAAMSLNCHRPMAKDSATFHWNGFGDSSAADLDPAAQAMTWLSCFQIGARLSAFIGLPVPICIPQHSKSLERAKILAGELLSADELAQIRILEIRCVAEVHLETIEEASSHYSMTQACDAQIDTIKSTAGDEWTTDAELQYQSTKLYIYGMTFVQELPASQDQQSQAMFYRQIILEKCLQAASSYISTMTELSDLTVGGKRHPIGALTFHPKHFYFTALMMAASSIFRFLVAYQGLSADQQQQAVQHLMGAHKIFQSFPDHRDAMRAAIHIEMMVNIVRTHSSPNSLPGYELTVKNRLGASIVYDSIFRASQQRNRRNMDGSSPPVTQWTTMNQQFSLVLPLAPEQKISTPQSQMWSGSPVSTSITQPDLAAWEVWDSYSNDFGVMTEPWLLNDAEFQKVYKMQQQQQQQQQVFSSAEAPTGIYETAMFPSVPSI